MTPTQTAFPAQQQEPPGLTDEMTPRPDHGEKSYRGSGKLTGKRALITGGDSGIGRAVALAFAREGAAVAITFMDEESTDADTTRDLVRAERRDFVALKADLRDSSECERVVHASVDALGGIDILVNNAAFQMARDDELTHMDDERLRRVVDTNLMAVLWLTRAALPHLKSGASIINTSSIQAYQPSDTLLDYAATKAALNNLTVNLAAQLGPKGIRVNAVAPGPIWTPLQPATQKPEKVQKLGLDTPLGRPGQPAEVAPAFVFLASDADASYVSGTVLGVTGGKPVF